MKSLKMAQPLNLKFGGLFKCEGMKKGRKLHLWQRDVSFNFQPTKGIHSVPTVKVKAIKKNECGNLCFRDVAL